MPRIRKILVPIEFSNLSLRVLDYALSLAARFHASVVLLHVVGPATYPQQFCYIGWSEAKEYEQATARLRELARRRAAVGVRVKTMVGTGIVFDEIVQTARNTRADLIVVFTHGSKGLKHAMLGSTAERIVRHAPCPVLIGK